MRKVLSFCSMAAAAELPLVAQGGGDKPPEHYAWHLTTPVTEINSPVAEGRSIESPDELSQCIATVRPSTLGGNDIRASDRLSKSQPWITPQNLGAPVNTEFADFCPTPLDGRWLVSRRASTVTAKVEIEPTPPLHEE